MVEPIKSIQILRLIAVISVIHVHLKTIPQYGNFGVDIFFVISGFIMALNVSKEKLALKFAIKRATKIVPLYWITTTTIYITIITSPTLFQSQTLERSSFQTYIKSLFFVSYISPDSWSADPILHVGWSLNYEIYFYALITLALYLKTNHTIKITGTLLTITFLAGQLENQSSASHFFRNDIFFEFIFGFIVYEVHQHKALIARPKILLIAIAMSSYLYMAMIEANGGLTNARSIDYGVPATTLTLASILLEKYIPQNNVHIRMLEGLGGASYAIYLTHGHIIAVLNKIFLDKLNLFDASSPIRALVTITLALLAGKIIHDTIEMPLSRHIRSSVTS